MTIRKSLPALFAALGLAWTSVYPAWTDVIPVENPSFETPALGDGAHQTDSVPGWVASFSDGSQYYGLLNPSETHFSFSSEPWSGVPDGTQFAWLNGSGTLTQALTATVQPNTDYTLRVSVGNNKWYTVGAYAVELQAGGEVLGSASPVTVNDAWVVATAHYRAVPLISWASVVGQQYRILRKPAVTDPNWTVVVDNYVATNTPSKYADIEAQGVKFYVIEVVP